MVQNNIRVKLAEHEMSGAALAELLPEEVNPVCVSFLIKGRVLPTPETMQVMCDTFKCAATDLYKPKDLTLKTIRPSSEQVPLKSITAKAPDLKAAAAAKEGLEKAGFIPEALRGADRHEGMEQLRIGMKAEEKAALFKAVQRMGYPSVAEWFREKYRELLREYIHLGIGDTKLHEAIPPTTQNQTV